MDLVTVATTEEDEEVILKVDQGIHKPDYKWLLMSTFHAWWSGAIVDNNPIHGDYLSRFGLVFHNDNDDDTVINSHLRGVVAGFNIRTPTYEDMKILPMYEVTIQLFWRPHDPCHIKNNKADQFSQGVG